MSGRRNGCLVGLVVLIAAAGLLIAFIRMPASASADYTGSAVSSVASNPELGPEIQRAPRSSDGTMLLAAGAVILAAGIWVGQIAGLGPAKRSVDLK